VSEPLTPEERVVLLEHAVANLAERLAEQRGRLAAGEERLDPANRLALLLLLATTAAVQLGPQR
jgi:hypothetical protein